MELEAEVVNAVLNLEELDGVDEFDEDEMHCISAEPMNRQALDFSGTPRRPPSAGSLNDSKKN